MCLLNGDSVTAVLSVKAGGSWSGVCSSERREDGSLYNLSTRPLYASLNCCVELLQRHSSTVTLRSECHHLHGTFKDIRAPYHQQPTHPVEPNGGASASRGGRRTMPSTIARMSRNRRCEELSWPRVLALTSCSADNCFDTQDWTLPTRGKHDCEELLYLLSR